MMIKIKDLRLNNKLSQENVARTANITLRQYQNIEAARCIPNVKTALLIAKALNCKVEDLYVLKENI